MMEPSPVFNHPFTFEFERSFDFETGRKFLREQKWMVFYIVAIYLVVIFGGRKLMASRERLSLRQPLLIWNLLLAVFSLMGALRTVPDVLHVLNIGLYDSVCTTAASVPAYWMFLFALSKIPELLDTVFIVLRKRKLTFLHWYHHIVTLLYVWMSMAESPYPARFFSSMNYVVHSLMYSYYAASCVGFKFHVIVPICLTSLQILQMFVGVLIHIYIYKLKLMSDSGCPHTYFYTHIGFAMYFSYLLLFGQFFYQNYVKKAKGYKKIN